MWVLLLTCWETAYRAVGWPPEKFPAPSHVLDAMLGMLNVETDFGGDGIGGGGRVGDARPRSPGSWYDSPLVLANLVSAARLVIGFVMTVLLGALLGLAMWRSAGLDAFLGPLFLGLQTLPSVCWVPLAVLAIGANEAGILFVLVMGSCFAVAIAMREGLRTIPPLYQQAGMMMGARGWRLYRYVLLPAGLPALAGSLRTGFSFAWRSLMGAELILIARRGGVGTLLHDARQAGDGAAAAVVAVMVVMVVIGMAADRWGFARLQRAVNARFGLGAVG